MSFSKLTLTLVKKFVSYRFFKIKFNLLLVTFSPNFASENINIVSAEILSLPFIIIFFKSSALVKDIFIKKINKTRFK